MPRNRETKLPMRQDYDGGSYYWVPEPIDYTSSTAPGGESWQDFVDKSYRGMSWSKTHDEEVEPNELWDYAVYWNELYPMLASGGGEYYDNNTFGYRTPSAEFDTARQSMSPEAQEQAAYNLEAIQREDEFSIFGDQFFQALMAFGAATGGAAAFGGFAPAGAAGTAAAGAADVGGSIAPIAATPTMSVPTWAAGGGSALVPSAAGAGAVGAGGVGLGGLFGGSGAGGAMTLGDILNLVNTGVGAGTAIAGGIQGANAARNAGQIQADAAANANKLLWDMYKQSRADQLPYLAAGYSALGKMGGMVDTPLTYGAWRAPAAFGPPGSGGLASFAGGGGNDTLAGGTGGMGLMAVADGGNASGLSYGDDDATSFVRNTVAGDPTQQQAADGLRYGSGDDATSFIRGVTVGDQGATQAGGQQAIGNGGYPEFWFDAGQYHFAAPNAPLHAQSWAYNAPAPVSAQQYAFTPPSGQQVLNDDPGYQFRLAEGMKALEASAAARGGLLSGATARGAQQYGQGLASQEYGAAYGRARDRNQLAYQRALQENADLYGRGLTANVMGYDRANEQNREEYTRALTENQMRFDRGLGANQLNFNRAYQHNQDVYNRGLQEYLINLQTQTGLRGQRWNELASLAGLGQTSGGQLGALGSRYGGAIGDNITGAGAANAAGRIGAANAWQDMLSGLGGATNNYLNYAMMRDMLQRR